MAPKNKFEVYEDNGGRHRWRVTAPNGEIVGASSQSFYAEREAILNKQRLALALREAPGEAIDGPVHYDGDECMQSIERDGYGLAFCLASAKKYLWRQGRKHLRVHEDVGKAQWYLARARGYDLLTPDELGQISDLEKMCCEAMLALESGEIVPDFRVRLRGVGEA